MLLSPGGHSARLALQKMGRVHVISRLRESLAAIHALGVWHGDPVPRNWLYDSESDNVVILDFENADIITSGPSLGIDSPNSSDNSMEQEQDGADEQAVALLFEIEMERAVYALRCLHSPLWIHKI